MTKVKCEGVCILKKNGYCSLEEITLDTTMLIDSPRCQNRRRYEKKQKQVQR